MDGSHPEEKSDFRITDPTPKRNLFKEPGIPPQRKLRVGELEIQKLVIKLLPPHNNNNNNNNNNNSHSSRT